MRFAPSASRPWILGRRCNATLVCTYTIINILLVFVVLDFSWTNNRERSHAARVLPLQTNWFSFDAICGFVHILLLQSLFSPGERWFTKKENYHVDVTRVTSPNHWMWCVMRRVMPYVILFFTVSERRSLACRHWRHCLAFSPIVPWWSRKY